MTQAVAQNRRMWYTVGMPRKGRPFSDGMRRAILERDGYRCAYCGGHAIFVDHINPRANGGENSYGNGVAVCRRCNYKKRDRLDILLLARGFFVASGNPLPQQSKSLPATRRSRPKPATGRRRLRVPAIPSLAVGVRTQPTILVKPPEADGVLPSQPTRTLSESSDAGDHRVSKTRIKPRPRKGSARAQRLDERDDAFLVRLGDLLGVSPGQYIHRLMQRHVQRQAKRRGWL